MTTVDPKMALPPGCDSTTLVFYVNGNKVVEKKPDPEETLLKYLRRRLLLTGTKMSCGQGACGSCTVMVSHYDRKNKKICHSAVVACLVPVCALHGLAVTTVEGVGSVSSKLHPIQEQLVKAHGTQCGYCTPGFVMSMYTLLRNNFSPSMAEVENAIKGNLCRCTGYRPILDGFKPFTKDYCPMGDQCCKRTSSASGETETNPEYSITEPTQDLIFPSELQLSDELDTQCLAFTSGSVTWIRPTSLQQLLHLKSLYPGSKIVSGNTNLGLERFYWDKHYPILLCVSNIAEMKDIVMTEVGIRFGAAVSLTTVEDYIRDLLIKNQNDHRYRGLKTFCHMLQEFAALQLKNMVTIGGCVASSWSNSDVIPLLCALRAEVMITSSRKPLTSVVLDENFFHGPGSTILSDSDIIVSVILPFLNKHEYAYSIKQSRRDFDTAIISTSAMVNYDEEKNTLVDMKIFLGNVLPHVFFAKNISAKLTGRFCEMSLTSDAVTWLQEEFLIIEQLGGKKLSTDIRSLTEVSIWKLVLQIIYDIHGEDVIRAEERLALYPLDRSYIKSTQLYEAVPSDQLETDAVGRPIVHRSAMQQATGEALYLDDTPHYENELQLAFVKSQYAHAHILEVDVSEAVKIAGVVDVLTYKDIPGKNHYGSVIKDEVVFAADEVTFYGQVIAAVLATSQTAAERGAVLVNVKYQPLPHITTIEEAIKADSYFDGSWKVNIGDVQLGFAEADEIVEGEVELGGQEHFYMETTQALAVPMKEDNELKVIVPTQSQTDLQKTLAGVLAIPENRIELYTKRIGGSFGGKECKYMVVLPVAVAAFKLKRPVRCVLDRDTDMQITGGRHPVLAKYKVGVKKSGKITSLELVSYANAGCTLGLSEEAPKMVLLSFDNCYRIPNCYLEGKLCKTNLPSNTAMRGFGRPQAIYIVETWMQHVAETLKLDPVHFREINMYKIGDELPFNCSSETFTTDRCWNEVKLKSDIKMRQKEVQEFNRINKYRKRGIHIGPLKYGMHIPVKFMYQASALVNIYLDGSVFVHHGGIEVGQGVHTKIIQIASRALGVPVEQIHVHGTDSSIVANSTVSAASFTSVSNGAAVMDACEKLKKRIEPYKEANIKGTWSDWVEAAYYDRVNLSATGRYKPEMPDFGYDWKTGKGRSWLYFTGGAACSEVEVDILTGQHVVRRVDIVMDVGHSLNPAIDIGQIEGAFLQGYGLYALEELKFDEKGHLKTRNAMGYKIPCVTNVPRQFNVTLLKDSGNPHAVYSAKGIGEPPLLLAHTVAFAIREAIQAYRKDIGLTAYFPLNSPVTPDKVRALCPRFYETQ